MHLFVIAGFLCVIIWLYLLVARGRFWMVTRLVAEAAPLSATGLVAVVIPARNEADVIGRSVKSLLQQRCEGSIRVFVVDDNSSDGTAEAAREAAASCARADAVRRDLWAAVATGLVRQAMGDAAGN